MDILSYVVKFGGIEEVDGHICFGQSCDGAGHIIILYGIVDLVTDAVFYDHFVSLQGIIAAILFIVVCDCRSILPEFDGVSDSACDCHGVTALQDRD